MKSLSYEQRVLFIQQILSLNSTLTQSNPVKTRDALELFENQLTLRELLKCLQRLNHDDHSIQLTQLLFKRWQRIRDTNLCYTRQAKNKVNALCLQLARALMPEAIEDLAPGTGPYCLLMPSIEQTEDICGEGNIHELSLSEFVLSKNERTYIPVYLCLMMAYRSDDGLLRHMVAIDNSFPVLTHSEMNRVKYHCSQSLAAFEALKKLNNQRLQANDFGARLNQLRVALLSGGTFGNGSEMNAGDLANTGILAFYQYWSSLSEQQQSAILTETPELNLILKNLFRSQDTNYEQVKFCVNIMAQHLDPIINKYNHRPTIIQLNNRFLEQMAVLKTILTSAKGPKRNRINKAPRFILHKIYKLPLNRQQTIFKEHGSTNALFYALEHSPDDLSYLALDEAEKQVAITARFTENNDSALIIAAKKGTISGLKTLLDWGADIESKDIRGSTALHWAAHNGNPEAVDYLISRNADLNAIGAGGNTALLFALEQGRVNIIDILLENKVSIRQRRADGINALDFAIRVQSVALIELFIMQIITLSIDEQIDCLLNCPQQPYGNALIYVMEKRPQLFEKLIDKILNFSDSDLQRDLLNSCTSKGYTPLIIAIQQGNNQLAKRLVQSGLVDIEAQDLKGSTAFHWAAFHGNIDITQYLLNHNANLNATGDGGYTALLFAAAQHKKEVVKLLLDNKAVINLRNHKGLNALDLAIRQSVRSPLVATILEAIIKCPVDVQEEFFSNFIIGRYPNALCFGSKLGAELFEKLIDSVNEQDDETFRRTIFNASIMSSAELINQQKNGQSRQVISQTIRNRIEQPQTPLSLAVTLNATSAIDKLIDSGLVDVNSKEEASHYSALHWAAAQDKVDAIHCLLKHNASLDIKNQQGHTPLTLAATCSKHAAFLLLLESYTELSDELINALSLIEDPEYIKPLIKTILKLKEASENSTPFDLCEHVLSNPLTSVFPILLDNDLFTETNHQNPALEQALTDMNFYSNMQNFYNHYCKMTLKSASNPSYIPAVQVTKNLLSVCLDAQRALFMITGKTTQAQLQEFKIRCKQAINSARPELAKYRELGKAITELSFAFFLLPISAPLYSCGLISPKTKSEQLLNNFDYDLECARPSSSSR